MRRQAVFQQLADQAPVIAPSLLRCDFGNLHREIELLEAADVGALHLDVMDGHFAPNLTYGPVVIRCLRKMTSLPFDTHLMMSEPERYLDEFIEAGCDSITIHLEAVPEPREVLKRIRDADVMAGLALNPETPVESVRPYVSDCDLILAMSVSPGFGGQEFQPVALEKLRKLKEWGGDTTILSVDGGINQSTISDVVAAGARLLVTGSAVFDTSDYPTAVQELLSLAATGVDRSDQSGLDETVYSSVESS
jgi:ribulose-phosphate 3-epimerase